MSRFMCRDYWEDGDGSGTGDGGSGAEGDYSCGSRVLTSTTYDGKSSNENGEHNNHNNYDISKYN